MVSSSRRPSFGRRPLAVVVVVLGLTAAACSSSPSSSGAASPAQAHQIVLAAVDKTEAVSTAALTIGISVTGTPSLGGIVPGATSSKALNLAISGHGVFDFTNKDGDLTLDLPAFSATKPATSIEIRVIGSDLYLNSPSLAALDGNKPWVHVSTQSYEQKIGQSDGPLGGFSVGDPSEVLGLLKDLTGSVTVVGPATVDGTSTTEYQSTVDLVGGGSTTSTILSKALAQALGLSSIPINVWIDGAGRLRQLKTSFSLLGLTVTALEGIGSFGTPVSVSPPPADQTADGTGLLNSGQIGSLLT